jgi:hypothetical protein
VRFIELRASKQGIDVGYDGQTITGGQRRDLTEEVPPVELWVFRGEFAWIVRLTTTITNSKADHRVDPSLREK